MTTTKSPDLAGTVYDPSVQIRPERISLPASSRLDSFTLVNGSGGVTIGEESCIHAFSSVVGNGGLDMGDRAVITYNATVLTSTADLSAPASSVVPREERESIRGKIRLGDETFVGSHAILTPGVRVEYAGVVAAGTYCDRDVPAGMILYPDGRLEERPGDWR